ncbi:MAG TPA: hypothetical protein VFL36_10585 [Myxococcales bacterium]|nr:hypothetical protein [Myxococcales bacterium]
MTPRWFAGFALALVVLGAAGFSQSSWFCAIRSDRLFTAAERDVREVYGSSRWIRSDEWAVETPQVRAQQLAGFPLVNLNEGIGELQRNTYDIPVLDWGLLLRPLTWPYFLPFRWSHGVRWFLRDALLLLGVFALLAAFVEDRRTAAAVAVAVFFSSAFVWWRSTVMIEFVGFLCLTGALAAWALRKRTAPAYLLTAWSAACSFCVFYPPVWAPMLWVVCAAVLDVAWRRKALATGGWLVALIGAGALLGIFYQLPYLSLISATAYPGRRIAHAGALPAGSLVDLLWPSLTVAAPVNCGPERVLGFEQTNACEAAAVEVIPLAALVAMAAVSARVRRAFANLFIARPLSVAAFVLLAAWLLLPLPDWFGTLTLLRWSPARRAWIAFGVGGALLTARVLAELRNDERAERIGLRGLAGVAAVIASAFMARSRVQLHLLSRCDARAWIPPLVAVAVLLCAGAVLLGTRRGAALLLAAWAGGVVLANHRVNPLIRSARMFATGEGHRVVESALARMPGRIVDYSTHPGAELAAFGWPIIGGVQNAPDRALFRFLAPDSPDLDEAVYDRYAHYSFEGPAKQSRVVQADLIRVALSPCSPRLAALGVNHFLADEGFDPGPGCAAAWSAQGAGELLLWSRRRPVCAIGVARGSPATALDYDYACPTEARLDADAGGFTLSVPEDPARSWSVAVNEAVIGSVECSGANARFVDAHLVVHPEGPRPRCRARYLDSPAALRRLLKR